MEQTPLTLTSSEIANAQREIANLFPQSLATLKEFVRIPGIAWEAFDKNQLERSAEFVRAKIAELGIFETVEILRAEYGTGQIGAPGVVARREPKANRPTILLYAHHDVQPPGDSNLWESEPFDPQERDGRLYGRGAADDKAGILAHLTALAALRNLVEDLEIGLVLFIEGEEEAGSPSFGNFLRQYRQKLAADVILVADSSNWTIETPALTTTLRGLVSQVVEIRTLDHAVHSGMYGGAVPDAMLALIKILGTMWDENGDVSISGLKTASESKLDYTIDQLRADSGMLPSTSAIGLGNILSRIWSKPALTVIGLDYPSVAISSNTLLPSVRAKLSLRLAPGDDPENALAALRRHILANNPLGAEISFGEIELGKPFQLRGEGWAKTLAEKALTAAYGRDSVDIGIGGSIPFIAELEEIFPDAQILVTGVEDPDSRAHSPNESLHLASFERAIVAETLMLLAGNRLTL